MSYRTMTTFYFRSLATEITISLGTWALEKVDDNYM